VSDAIFSALATRYMLPEWVLVPQVRDGTGFSSSRTADAVAMNCYPSKGLEIHGFEFKTARSDWLRELRDGSKAETVAQHCNRWWIVATEGVVVRAELPTAWGLIVAKDGAIRTLVAAPPLPCSDAAGPVDRSFIASFLRCCLERAKAPTDEALRAAREQGRKAERKELEAERQRMQLRLNRETSEAQKAIEEFEAASGVRISSYDGTRQGEAFKAFQELREARRFDGIELTAVRLRELADSLEALAAEVPTVGEAR